MIDIKEGAVIEREGESKIKLAGQRRTRKASPVAKSSHTKSTPKSHQGLEWERVFSREGVHPFDQIEWEQRTAEITDDAGKVIFKQDDVEVPKSWSPLATKVVVSKYFYGEHRTKERERSVKQLINRVTRTIADWGKAGGYFKSDKDAETFYEELTWLCVNQYGSFNSPVWFNAGLYHLYGIGKLSGQGNWYFDRKEGKVKRAASQYEYPQCSACFIQDVKDTMEGIMSLATSEAMLFKYGSGTGTDLSTLRSSREKLSGGGRPSGPISFLRVYDSIASVVKSGGKTRRAAKMNTLKVWHPDIKEFIEAKLKEEKKAWALIEQGYEGDFNGDAYSSVAFQNENLSVRATDEFMKAAVEDRDWQTHWVTDPRREGPTYKARDLLQLIAEGTWTCGDPGMQYEDTIQRWHTCKNSGSINSSNPCSEYMFLDNTACNLASLNLMKFMTAEGVFDVERFKAAVRVFITAQEIIVDNASYPTEPIALNSHLFRPLGLGYANLGSLIMSMGLPYDSDEGRGLAGALTAIMHLHAYEQSARIAGQLGPFESFEKNREPMLEVMEMHRAAVKEIHASCPKYLRDAAQKTADAAVELGKINGYRNSQVTVLAPTGTIAFMMDCDTTGIEPDIALVKYKLLAGGGMLKIVNRTVPMALKKLGYKPEQIDDVLKHIEKRETIEGAPHVKDEHLPVFDCAFKALHGKRTIHYMGHIKMMGAVQPFLSGAISKTVNMPKESTIEEIMSAYIEGWRYGLKALAIYRDGSKRSQPLSTGKAKKGEIDKAQILEAVTAPRPVRRRLPDTRTSITHKFDIAGHEGYITVGLFEDGMPGELFITMAKEGSTIGGLMDTIGTLVSMSLQYGVPIETLVKKFAHQRFEPSGFTKNPDIPNAKSVIDYIFRWLAMQFIRGYREANSPHRGQAELPMMELKEIEKKAINRPVADLPLDEDSIAKGEKKGNGHGGHGPSSLNESVAHLMEDAPQCPVCGHIAVRNGACYRCLNCGESLGCS